MPVPVCMCATGLCELLCARSLLGALICFDVARPLRRGPTAVPAGMQWHATIVRSGALTSIVDTSFNGAGAARRALAQQRWELRERGLSCPRAGTFLNGVRLAKNKEAPLEHGTVVSFVVPTAAAAARALPALGGGAARLIAAAPQQHRRLQLR